ncbi:S9 family peptidase [Woodsholea maritima]|uniref:S9 family peptidase n=1 Tax=Woodsholea maritima TaxID=240237 RepID=UPI000363FFCB|nr:alpha/beta fold hydrolase [Woodsholea maritima]
MFFKVFKSVSLCVVLALSASASLYAQSEIPVEAFARLPAIDSPALSPSGQLLAYISNTEDQKTLVIQRLNTQESRAIDASQVRPTNLIWINDDILLIQASTARRHHRAYGVLDVGAVYAIDLTRSEIAPRQLLHGSSRIGLNFSLGRIIQIDREREDVYMPAFDDQRNYGLFKVNARTGRSERVDRGSPYTEDWIVSTTGELLAREERNQSEDTLQLQIRQGNQWRVALEEKSDLPQIDLVGYDRENGSLIVYTRSMGNEDTSGLFRIDTQDQSIETIFQHDKLDARFHLTRDFSGELMYAAYEDSELHYIWFDDDMELIYTSIKAAMNVQIPNSSISLLDWTPDRKTIIFYGETNYISPYYGLFKPETGEISLLGWVYPELGSTILPQRSIISYQSQDGQVLPAYLTLPSGEGPHPFIVLPHGGPQSRDYSGFDDWAHFFASRGYGVIQPNFRGSSGYGNAYILEGYGEWGKGLMQQDLTDARQAVIDAGLADPERICIVGASYGGYAALAGAAFTPDLYKCAISYSGVSDLEEMIRFERNRYGEDRDTHTYWQTQMLGLNPPSDETQFLQQRSPVRAVDAIQAPILLMHGGEDSVVSVEQSRRMNRALDNSDKSVRYIEIEHGDHWLTSYETRLAVFTAMERFLDEHLQ